MTKFAREEEDPSGVNHGDVTIDERVLWVPKGDHEAEEYEDAAFASEAGAWPLRAAVADGATESAFARDWAKQLVRNYTSAETMDTETFPQQLRAWQDRFQQNVQQRSREEQTWYAEQKAEEGAFATLMGLTLQRDGSWQSLAVGDCCLFQIRDGAVFSWPFDASDAFGDRPALVPSKLERTAPSPQTHGDDWQPGDAFVLATDALSAWLLAEEAAADLFALTPDAFQQVVESARREEALRDDDTTALTLEIAVS